MGLPEDDRKLEALLREHGQAGVSVMFGVPRTELAAAIRRRGLNLAPCSATARPHPSGSQAFCTCGWRGPKHFYSSGTEEAIDTAVLATQADAMAHEAAGTRL